MSEGMEKTGGGMGKGTLVVAVILAAIAGAGIMYLLTPKAPLSPSEAVEIVGGSYLEGLPPEAKLRTWASAFATYTFLQINQIYTVYNWDMRMWYEPGAWNMVNVDFTGEFPNGDLYTFDLKVHAQ